jgi:hypothetical protein
MKFAQDEWVVCRVFQKTTGIKKATAPAYQVTMARTEIDQNQNNVPSILIPMPLQLPLPVPMPVFVPMQFPILPDFAMDLVAPYYPNVWVGMPPMMPPVAGISGAGGLQINSTLFGNPIVMSPQINFYHHMGMWAAAGQMDMGAAAGQIGMGAAVAQMDMGAAGASGFDGAATVSSPSSMVSQKGEPANATEISSMMSVTGLGSMTTTIEMDGIWKYKY